MHMRQGVCINKTFPNHRLPCSRTFSRIAQRLRERGTFIPVIEGGRPRTARTVQQEQRILAHVAAKPGTSTRRMSSAEGVHRSTLWMILHEDRLYPYHLQCVQGLKPEDLLRHVRFCQFLWKLLLTDEAMFTRDGIFNFHNVHIWTHANPHTIREANVDELWERIVATFDAIRNRPGQLERVRESMMRRLNECVAASYVILKGYQHMNVSRYLGTCSFLDPC